MVVSDERRRVMVVVVANCGKVWWQVAAAISDGSWWCPVIKSVRNGGRSLIVVRVMMNIYVVYVYVYIYIREISYI